MLIGNACHPAGRVFAQRASFAPPPSLLEELRPRLSQQGPIRLHDPQANPRPDDLRRDPQHRRLMELDVHDGLCVFSAFPAARQQAATASSSPRRCTTRSRMMPLWMSPAPTADLCARSLRASPTPHQHLHRHTLQAGRRLRRAMQLCRRRRPIYLAGRIHPTLGRSSGVARAPLTGASHALLQHRSGAARAPLARSSGATRVTLERCSGAAPSAELC